MDSHRFLEIVRGRRRLILASSAAVAAIALLLSWRLATYDVTATVLIRPVATEPAPSVGLIPPLPGTISTFGGTYSTILRSRPVAERIADRLGDLTSLPEPSSWRRIVGGLRRVLQLRSVLWNLRLPRLPESPREQLIADLRELLVGELLPNTTVFRIDVSERDPEFAVRLARIAAESFVEYSREANAFEASATGRFLDGQIAKVEKELERVRAALRKFRNEFRVRLSLVDEGRQRITDLMALETSRDATDREIVLSRGRIARLEADLEDYPEVVETSETVTANPVTAQLRLQRTQIETELALLRQDFTAEHPQVEALEEQMRSIDDLIARTDERIDSQAVTALNPVHQSLLADLATERVTLAGLQAERRALAAQLDRLTAEVANLTDQQGTWSALTARLAFQEQRLAQLRSDRASAELTQAKELGEIEVLDVSQPSLYPTWKGLPLLFFGVMGLVLGLLGGTGAALAIDALDPGLKGPRVTADALGLPLYGVVADAPREPGGPAARPGGPTDPAYQRLWLKLETAGPDGRPVQAVVVGSVDAPDPTGVVLRVAEAAAAAGADVLVVDGRPAGVPALPQPAGVILVRPGEATDGAPVTASQICGLVDKRRAPQMLTVILADSLDRSVDAIRLARLGEVDALMLVIAEETSTMARGLAAKAQLDEFEIVHAGLIYLGPDRPRAT